MPCITRSIMLLCGFNNPRLLLKADACAGHDCYVVGGAVRDMLSNRAPQDVDILTSATHHRVRESLATLMATLSHAPGCEVCMLQVSGQSIC